MKPLGFVGAISCIWIHCCASQIFSQFSLLSFDSSVFLTGNGKSLSCGAHKTSELYQFHLLFYTNNTRRCQDTSNNLYTEVSVLIPGSGSRRHGTELSWTQRRSNVSAMTTTLRERGASDKSVQFSSGEIHGVSGAHVDAEVEGIVPGKPTKAPAWEKSQTASVNRT